MLGPDSTALLGPVVGPSRAGEPDHWEQRLPVEVRPAMQGCPRNPRHPPVNKFPRACPRFLSPPRTLFASTSTGIRQ